MMLKMQRFVSHENSLNGEIIKMRYILILMSVFLTGCSSVRYVTMDHGQLVTQSNQPVDIVGNPPMMCHYENSPKMWSGYFMYHENDMIVLDDFGRGTIEMMDNPICELRLDSNESN